MNPVKQFLMAMSICLSIQSSTNAMRYDDPNDPRSPAGQQLIAAQAEAHAAFTTLIHRNWQNRRHDLAATQRLEQEIKQRKEKEKNCRIKRGLLKGEIAMALLSAL